MSSPLWTPGSVVPCGSRFRWAPTGPLHIGHLWVAWLNQQAARATGGTFGMRLEQLKTTCCTSRRNAYDQYAQSNFDELWQLGVRPSPPESWLVHDMDPAWAWQPTDDRAPIDYYWRLCGLEAVWGKWPPPCDLDPGAVDNHWQGMMLGAYHQGHMHPYLLFAQVAGDVLTKRNCLIRGEDLRAEANMVNAFAQVLAQQVHHLPGWDTAPQFTPAQYYVPRLLRSGTRLPVELQEVPGVSLSSSVPEVITGFRIKDVLAAGVPLSAAVDLLARVYLQKDAAWVQAELGEHRVRRYDNRVECLDSCIPQNGVDRVVKLMRDPAVVDDDEWFALLKGK